MADQITTLTVSENAPSHDPFNRTDPRAVLNLVTPAVQSAFMGAYAKRPDLFGLDERALRQALRNENLDPGPTENRLRLAFWMEYDRAQTNLKPLTISRIYEGTCAHNTFALFLEKAEKVAWLLCPVASYEMRMREALDFGMNRLREILELPIYDAKGKPDVRVLELQAKIIAMIDQRVNGAVVQRIEQKNMNLNIATTNKEVAAVALSSSMEELDRRIKELDRRERQALNLPDALKPVTIEVEATPVKERPDGQ